MNVVLNIKNASKVIKPTKNSVILCDGKDWYITTKEQLFEEWTGLLSKCENTLEETKQDNTEFKKEVGRQLKQMTDLIHKLFEAKGEDLWKEVSN